MNRRIKKRFDELGIEIPFPHRSLYFGEASRPFEVSLSEPEREALKQTVGEVLEEKGISAEMIRLLALRRSGRAFEN